MLTKVACDTILFAEWRLNFPRTIPEIGWNRQCRLELSAKQMCQFATVGVICENCKYHLCHNIMERMFARSKNKHHKIGDVHLFPTHYYLNGLTKESKYGRMSIEHSTFNIQQGTKEFPQYQFHTDNSRRCFEFIQIFCISFAEIARFCEIVCTVRYFFCQVRFSFFFLSNWARFFAQLLA